MGVSFTPKTQEAIWVRWLNLPLLPCSQLKIPGSLILVPRLPCVGLLGAQKMLAGRRWPICREAQPGHLLCELSSGPQDGEVPLF